MVKEIRMPAQMPARDEAVLKRRSEIVRALRALVPGEGVISAEREMRPYECDGLTAYRQLPLVVVLPRTVDEVSRVLRYLQRDNYDGRLPTIKLAKSGSRRVARRE